MGTPKADSPSSNHNSPTDTTVPSSVSSAETATNSPNLARRNLPSPWAQVVRGADSEPPSAVHQSPPSSSSSSSSNAAAPADQPSSSADSSLPAGNSNSNAAAVVYSSDADKDNTSNVGPSKKPAWKRPSNGVPGSVMGSISWPLLSESTTNTSKFTPGSSSKPPSDGSLSTPQGPVTSPSPQKHAGSNAIAKPNSAQSNYGAGNRQRPMKRGGSGSANNIGSVPAQNNFTNASAPLSPPPLGPAQSNFSNHSAPPQSPPPPPPFPIRPIPPSTFPNGVPGVPDHSPRDPYRNNNWDARPQAGGFVAPQPMIESRGPSRRGNFGHHPRGDGSYHNNYGGRRDQDRGNYTHARDAHVHQPRMLPRGMRPLPPHTPSYMGPQPMRPFPNPAGFPEFYYFPTLQFETFRGMPFFTHGPPPAMFFPVAESPLTNLITKQIDYYFSDANLVKDDFLRSNMDEHGWVPITLIASFPRVISLTSNIELILDSLRTSTVVEVQGDRIRKRDEWMKWLPAAHLRSNSVSISHGESSSNNATFDFEKITLDEASTDKVDSGFSTNVDIG